MYNSAGEVHDDVCQIQGFIKNLGGLATFLFVMYASIKMMQQIKLFESKNREIIRKYNNIFSAFFIFTSSRCIYDIILQSIYIIINIMKKINSIIPNLTVFNISI